MMKTVTSTELQKNTREVIDWARTRSEAVVIETYGKPMAALLSYDEYQAYQQYKQARAARFAHLRQAAAANTAANTLSEAEAMALVDTERQALYEEQGQARDTSR
jgi:prevent-host-death family protein